MMTKTAAQPSPSTVIYSYKNRLLKTNLTIRRLLIPWTDLNQILKFSFLFAEISKVYSESVAKLLSYLKARIKA